MISNRDLRAEPGQTERQKEVWLEYHERYTNGIPGILPLTLDLPVRFTDSPNPQAKEQGIYKFTKGIVRGWQLEEAEANRVANVGDASEVVLLRRPTAICVEVPTANDKLVAHTGKNIYIA